MNYSKEFKEEALGLSDEIALKKTTAHTGGDNSITFRYIPTAINCGS